jgi:homoserine O-acetyltransferase/O-succinyltransferase
MIFNRTSLICFDVCEKLTKQGQTSLFTMAATGVRTMASSLSLVSQARPIAMPATNRLALLLLKHQFTMNRSKNAAAACALPASIISTSAAPSTTTILSSSLRSGAFSDVEMIAANHRISSLTPLLISCNIKLSTGRAAWHSSSCTRRTMTTTNTQLQATTTTMKDEYGAMDDSGLTYIYDGDFVLENGQVLPNAQLRYQTYGKLNEQRDNVVVVCHALTGNASLHKWWGDLLGPHRAFCTEKYFIVCCNILGSCYGSTCPLSINPATNQPYGMDFPDVSVQDTVRIQLLMLQNHLKVNSIKCVIGGSFGGMQAVEFAVQAGSQQAEFTDHRDGNPFLRSFVPIACGAQHTAWQIAISEVQRQAIYKDPNWKSGNHMEARDGLEIARQLGMISYRTPKGYVEKFGRGKQQNDSPEYGSNAAWNVKSYLEYQGVKFLQRFDPITYVKMTEQMDSHDVARGRGAGSSSGDGSIATTVESVLAQVEIPGMVLGIDSDVLYPLSEQEYMAKALPNGCLKVIHSDDGHDGFLLEQEQVGNHIINFLSLHE